MLWIGNQDANLKLRKVRSNFWWHLHLCSGNWIVSGNEAISPETNEWEFQRIILLLNLLLPVVFLSSYFLTFLILRFTSVNYPPSVVFSVSPWSLSSTHFDMGSFFFRFQSGSNLWRLLNFHYSIRWKWVEIGWTWRWAGQGRAHISWLGWSHNVRLGPSSISRPSPEARCNSLHPSWKEQQLKCFNCITFAHFDDRLQKPNRRDEY